MALLSGPERAAIQRRIATVLSSEFASIDVNKGQLIGAVNAIDQWLEDNTASLNAALPAPARNGLTARQKAMLLMFVMRRRFELEA